MALKTRSLPLSLIFAAAVISQGCATTKPSAAAVPTVLTVTEIVRQNRVMNYLDRVELLTENEKEGLWRGLTHDDVPCYNAFNDSARMAICNHAERILAGTDRNSARGDTGLEDVENYLARELELKDSDRKRITDTVVNIGDCNTIEGGDRVRIACTVAELSYYNGIGWPPGLHLQRLK